MTTTFTRYFRFGLPDFLSEPWHDQWYDLVNQIDATLYKMLLVQEAAIWVNSHVYAVGDIAISPQDGGFFVCSVAHTSAASPTTFSTDRTNHPTFWVGLTSTLASQAEAIAGTDNVKYMSPLRSAQQLAALIGSYISSFVAGPLTSTDSFVPQWNGTTGLLLKAGLGVGTGPNQLVQLNGSSQLPALDGSLLLNAGLLSNTRLAKTANYIVANADKGKTLALGGTAFNSLTFNAASGYDANFAVMVVNEDAGRAKKIVISGGTTFKLYPGQVIVVLNQNNVWQVQGKGRYKLTGSTTFYVATTGSDTLNDGMDPSSPYLTDQAIYNTMLTTDLDFGGQDVLIQKANGTYTTTCQITAPWVGGGTLTFSGNQTFGSWDQVINDVAGFYVYANFTVLPGALTIQYMKLRATAGAGVPDLLRNAGIGIMQYRAITFNDCASIQVVATGNGAIMVGLSVPNSKFTGAIIGAAVIHGYQQSQGQLFERGACYVFTSLLNFSTAYFFNTGLGFIAGNVTNYLFNSTGTYLFQGTTHGTTTIDGIASTAGLSVGMEVVHNQLATGTKITAVGANSITVSNAASGSTAGQIFVYGYPRATTTGSTHTNTTLDALAINTNQLSVGMLIRGSGIPAGATIASFSSSSALVMSAAATTSVAGGAIKFEVARGPKYFVDSNSVTLVGSGDADTLPGDIAGSIGPSIGEYVT